MALPQTQNKYRDHLRPFLPREAFDPNPTKIFTIAINILLIALSVYTLTLDPGWLATCFLIIIIGHLFAANGFLAHEVSHGNIIRNRRGRYLLELATWLPVMIAPTMWHRLHNVSHHAHVNTTKDPDRRFLPEEQNTTATHFSRFFYPNGEIIAWTPLPFLYFIPYLLRNNIAAIFQRRLPVSHTVPTFSRREMIACFGEWSLLVGIHFTFVYTTDFSILLYLSALVFPVLVASVIFVGFVATQHWLNPIHDVADPLLGSTSVKVPVLIDRVYKNVSWHTEHHIFPQLDPDWYPEVGRLLRREFPEQYQSITIGEAWSRLWRSPRLAVRFTEDSTF